MAPETAFLLAAQNASGTTTSGLGYMPIPVEAGWAPSARRSTPSRFRPAPGIAVSGLGTLSEPVRWGVGLAVVGLLGYFLFVRK